MCSLFNNAPSLVCAAVIDEHSVAFCGYRLRFGQLVEIGQHTRNRVRKTRFLIITRNYEGDDGWFSGGHGLVFSRLLAQRDSGSKPLGLDSCRYYDGSKRDGQATTSAL